MTQELTSREYWEETYRGGEPISPVNPSGFRNRAIREVAEKIEPYVARSTRVLEIGGGGSSWLAYFAEKYPHVSFSALDYSEHGARLLNAFIKRKRMNNLSVLQGNFFSSHEVAGTFDFIYSLGVVEHFSDLSEVMRAISGYLGERGNIFTLIPNMNGLNGCLTRTLNRSVYDIHVPHDLEAFRKFHHEVGLIILESGYLCSNNFGVLSSCIKEKHGWKWPFYKTLTRFGKMIWYMEDKFRPLPKTPFFSPYLYAISTRPSSEAGKTGDEAPKEVGPRPA